jgi:heat shock protein HslJ
MGARAGDAAGTAGAAAGEAATTVEARLDDRLLARVWQWQETTGTAGGPTRPEDASAYTVTFVPGGAIAVQADCRQAGGTFTSDTDTMQVDVKVTTTDPCASGSLADTFVAQLTEVAAWTVEGENLTLVLAGDAGTMHFRAQ